MALQSNKRVITVFGSSKPKPAEPEYRLAYRLGELLAIAGLEICNGGYGGVMEASAHGAKDRGGKTIGVITEHFRLSANPYIDEIISTETLIDRLSKLIEVGDAYVVLKGSTGTLVEFSLVWEYMNKSVMQEKPIVVIGNFWAPVVNSLKKELVHEGLEQVTKFVNSVNSPEECVALLKKKLNATNQPQAR